MMTHQSSLSQQDDKSIKFLLQLRQNSNTAELNQLAIEYPHLLIPHLTHKHSIIIVTGEEKEDTMQENAHNP